MKTLNEEQKRAIIGKLVNLRIDSAMIDEFGQGKPVSETFIHVLKNAELIRGFTKNDILRCRQIGIAIGYYVKAERYIVRQAKDHNEEFIQNGFAYKLAK